MKLFAIFSIGLALASVMPTQTRADDPVYTTLAGAGNASGPATVIFPASVNSTIRLVSIQWQSDSNTANLEFQAGAGQYTLLNTNTSSGVTQQVASTAGLVTNNVLVLQHSNVCYAATLVQTNNGTNIVLNTGAWGVAPSIGDNVYQLGTTNSVPVGATTNWQNGEALFSGTRGRPVRVRLNPALATNRLPAVVARYQ